MQNNPDHADGVLRVAAGLALAQTSGIIAAVWLAQHGIAVALAAVGLGLAGALPLMLGGAGSRVDELAQPTAVEDSGLPTFPVGMFGAPTEIAPPIDDEWVVVTASHALFGREPPRGIA
jgi:hypothetical protein